MRDLVITKGYFWCTQDCFDASAELDDVTKRIAARKQSDISY